MPRVNIYIREGDVEKWELIDNKSEWISEHLNQVTTDELYGVTVDITKATSFTDDPSKDKPIKKSHKKMISEVWNNPPVCKNGHILSTLTGRCTQKDCKYA